MYELEVECASVRVSVVPMSGTMSEWFKKRNTLLLHFIVHLVK